MEETVCFVQEAKSRNLTSVLKALPLKLVDNVRLSRILVYEMRSDRT